MLWNKKRNIPKFLKKSSNDENLEEGKKRKRKISS
jgi:hypothetical protein